MKKEVSVIIPAYNEEKQIDATVSSVVRFFRDRDYAFEVLLVNDGSTDATGRKADELQSRFPEVRHLDLRTNRGKGQAVKEGIASARYHYSLFTDADNATPVEEWVKFEEQFQKGAKAVVASRRLPGSRIRTPQPLLRRAMGGFYRFLCRGLFGLKASDFNCGFKAYESTLAKEIYSAVQLSDWAFDTEVFCLLQRRGIEPAEVPVSWSHCEKASGLSPIRAGLWTLGSLWRLKKKFP